MTLPSIKALENSVKFHRARHERAKKIYEALKKFSSGLIDIDDAEERQRILNKVLKSSMKNLQKRKIRIRNHLMN